MNLLIENGLTFSRHYDKHIIKDIKEKKCYVSDDFESEMVSFKEHTSSKEIIYELPDKQVINIGTNLIQGPQQIQAPEILFNPGLIGRTNCLGIGELIYKTYFSIDMEIKKSLFDKIVLLGGNMLFKNIAERISRNIKSFGGNTISYKLLVPAERKYSVWIGGSILASLSTFKSILISKSEYDEYGPEIVNIKRF